MGYLLNGWSKVEAIHPSVTAMERATALSNSVRLLLGAEALPSLPTAVTGDPADCLFARAFGDMGASVSVGGEGKMRFDSSERGREVAAVVARVTGGKLSEDGFTVDTPPVFAEVISHFDGHAYPEFS